MTLSLDHPRPLVSRPAPSPWAVIAFWRSRRRQRLTLAELTDAELADIGIDRRAARAECAKPFWR